MESFPRGGEKPKINKGLTSLHKKNEQKKKHKTQTKKRKGDSITEETSPRNVTRLYKKDIQKGMIILGRVDEIRVLGDEMFVSLPGGNVGIVSCFGLGQSYLHGISHISTDLDAEKFQPMTNLYERGDYVVCYVKENTDSKKICLSLEPQLINQGVSNQFLAKGAKIVCTIKSVEDNGYEIETGMPNVKAFLASKNTDGENPSYLPGKQLFCVIKNIKTTDNVSIIQLSAKKKIINKVSVYDTVYLDSITPGTKLSLRVVKCIKDGLQVAFGNNIIGCVHYSHFEKGKTDYQVGDEVTGLLLYVLPLVKLAYFSLLINDCTKRFFHGDFVENCELVRVIEGKGILLRLPPFEDNLCPDLGFVPRHKMMFALDNLAELLAHNNAGPYRCVVIAYRWMEQIYLCSCEKGRLSSKISYDFEIGDIVEDLLVTSISNTNYVYVKKLDIYGYVPPEHVSDDKSKGFQGISKDLGSLLGKTVLARVLNIDYFEKHVIFTLKRSLIESELPVLSNIAEAKCGIEYHGTVLEVRDKMKDSVIEFYGGVKGYLPHDDEGFSNVWNSIGKTVTVRVRSIDKESSYPRDFKLTVDLMELSFREKPIESRYSIGDKIEGLIKEVVGSGDEMGMVVEVLGKPRAYYSITEIGFLPAALMAPSFELGCKLLSHYEVGKKILACVFAMRPRLLLTRNFIPEVCQSRFNLLTTDTSILCSIRDVSTNIVRVVLPIEDYHDYGTISIQNTSNSELLRKYQPMYVKINVLNKREKQFYLTMHLNDIWKSLGKDKQLNASMEVILPYLAKTNELLQLKAAEKYEDSEGHPITKIALGQKVSGQIISESSDSFKIHVENGVTAYARKEHCHNKCKLGDQVQGVVMWRDEHLHISLLPKIMNNISSKQDILPSLPHGLALKATILMVTEWFVLVLVKYNKAGYLACLPVRQHLNDISPVLTDYKIHAKVRVYCMTYQYEAAIMPVCVLKSVIDDAYPTGLDKKPCQDKWERKRPFTDNEYDMFDIIYPPSKRGRI